MNTAHDIAKRIAAVTVRSRDLFWIFSITTLAHLVIFTTIIGIMGSLDCMKDIKAIGMNRGEVEVNTHFQKRFDNVQWGAFKGLIVAGFALTALAELYVMYMI